MLEILTIKEDNVWLHPSQAKRGKTLMDLPVNVSGNILSFEGIEEGSRNAIITTGTGILYLQIEETNSGYESIIDFSQSACNDACENPLEGLSFDIEGIKSRFSRKPIAKAVLFHSASGELLTAIGTIRALWIPIDKVFIMVRTPAAVPTAQKIINEKETVIYNLMRFNQVEVQDIETTSEGGLMFIVRPEYFDKMQQLITVSFLDWIL